MTRRFTEVLAELSAGETLDALSERLAAVVEAVMETGKAGELTVKLKVKANGEKGVLVTDEIRSKVPERSRGETVFFAGEGGALVRHDPRQSSLPLRRVGEVE